MPFSSSKRTVRYTVAIEMWRIEGGGAAVQFLDVGMVGGFGQDPGDDPALSGHLQASFDAQALDARFHPIPCDQSRQPSLPDHPVPAKGG